VKCRREAEETLPPTFQLRPTWQSILSLDSKFQQRLLVHTNLTPATPCFKYLIISLECQWIIDYSPNWMEFNCSYPPTAHPQEKKNWKYHTQSLISLLNSLGNHNTITQELEHLSSEVKKKKKKEECDLKNTKYNRNGPTKRTWKQIDTHPQKVARVHRPYLRRHEQNELVQPDFSRIW